MLENYEFDMLSRIGDEAYPNMILNSMILDKLKVLSLDINDIKSKLDIKSNNTKSSKIIVEKRINGDLVNTITVSSNAEVDSYIKEDLAAISRIYKESYEGYIKGTSPKVYIGGLTTLDIPKMDLYKELYNNGRNLAVYKLFKLNTIEYFYL